MKKLKIGTLRHRVTFLRKGQTGTDPAFHTPIYEWRPVASVAANVQENLPVRGESEQAAVIVARVPVKVTVRQRAGLDGSMRIQAGTRTLRIISGPAVDESGVGMTFMAEHLTTEGEEL